MDQAMFEEFDKELNEKLKNAQLTVTRIEASRNDLDNQRREVSASFAADRKGLTGELQKARKVVRECNRRLGKVRPRRAKDFAAKESDE